MKRQRTITIDDVVRPPQQRRRHGQPEGFRRLQVDNELEVRGLLDRKIGGLSALQDLVHEDRCSPPAVDEVRAIRHEPTLIDVVPEAIDGWQSGACDKLGDSAWDRIEEQACVHDHSRSVRGCCIAQGPLEFVRI